jgi:hypothetical protein
MLPQEFSSYIFVASKNQTHCHPREGGDPACGEAAYIIKVPSGTDQTPAFAGVVLTGD